MLFPESERIKFFALLNGYCWLRIDEQEEPVRMEKGDVIFALRTTFLHAFWWPGRKSA
jgi:hypothetical protein